MQNLNWLRIVRSRSRCDTHKDNLSWIWTRFHHWIFKLLLNSNTFFLKHLKKKKYNILSWMPAACDLGYHKVCSLTTGCLCNREYLITFQTLVRSFIVWILDSCCFIDCQKSVTIFNCVSTLNSYFMGQACSVLYLKFFVLSMNMIFLFSW